MSVRSTSRSQTPTQTTWRLGIAGVIIFALAGAVLWHPAFAQSDDRAKKASLELGQLGREAIKQQVSDKEQVGGEPQTAADSGEPVASVRPRQTLMASLTIFVLAVLVGFEVITKVPPTLHTPLMSGSNAISGITLVGALFVAGTASGTPAFLGFLAVVFAMVNVMGGFLVTHRMLKMFQKR